MTAVGSVIAGIAAKAGARLVGKAVSGAFGQAGGELAESVIGTIAGRLGVPVEDIPSQPEDRLTQAVRETERTDMPELMALWGKGLEGQFALLQAETAEGFWPSAWRWGWMYLLGLFWVHTILLAPVLRANGIDIEGVDVAVLLTLTTWFISLYMGGHTVKALGESAINAVLARKVSK